MKYIKSFESHRELTKQEPVNEEFLFGLLGKYTDKDPKQVMEDANRDLWLNADEALAYGIIDNVITSKTKKTKKAPAAAAVTKRN